MYVPAILFSSALLPTLSLKGGDWSEWFTLNFANIELESKRRFGKGTLSHTTRGVDFHLIHVCIMSD